MHGYLIHHGNTDSSNNVLVPEGGDHGRHLCEICYNVMGWFNHYFVCLACGWKVHEDKLKPKSRLVAKDDDDDFMIQPGKAVNNDPDVPAGAHIVETWES